MKVDVVLVEGKPSGNADIAPEPDWKKIIATTTF